METNGSVKSNLFWKLLERFSSQGVSFIITVVLARILQPSEFGTLALLMVFINLLQIFVDSGLGSALIQKKGADEEDFSTVLIFNLILSVLMYSIMFLISPLIANFYKQPDLTLVIRVLSCTILISGLKNIQISRIAVSMQFKNLFFATLSGAILSGFLGIHMAYNGYGVWALVFQIVVNALISTIVLWIVMRWKPKITFSLTRLKDLASFGWKIFFTSLINTIYDDVTILIIGKIFSAEELAFYDQGRKYPQVIISNINTSLDSVLFPAMSRSQDNQTALLELTKKSIILSSYILFPIMAWLAVCANSLITLIVTDKWLQSVPYVYIFCFFYALYPINTANINVLKATGRSNVLLTLEIIKKIYGIGILLITLKYGVLYIAVGLAFSGLINCIITALPVRKIVGYSLIHEIRDIFPTILITVALSFTIYTVGLFISPLFYKVLVQTAVGVIEYIILSVLTRNKAYKYYKQLMITLLKKVHNSRGLRVNNHS